MINAKDMAERLGISISTVGRAMADDPRISRATKDRVRRLAAEIGYVGNGPARFVRSGTSNLVGLLIPDVENDFYSAIAQALSTCLDDGGYRLVLSLTRDDPAAEAKQIAELVGARVAGIILVPTAEMRKESVTLLRSVPHIQLLRRLAAVPGSWFGIDDNAGMYQAMRYLLDQGHRKIAYVGGGKAYSTGADRYSGVHRAAAEQGITPLVELGPPTSAFGAEATNRLLAESERPTALLSGSFHITLGMLEVLQQSGMRIPDELSVVGFGDPPWAAWCNPRLTTVRPPVRDLAQACGEWLLSRLGGDKRRQGSGSLSPVQPRLIVRDSVRILTDEPAATKKVAAERPRRPRARKGVPPS